MQASHRHPTRSARRAVDDDVQRSARHSRRWARPGTGIDLRVCHEVFVVGGGNVVGHGVDARTLLAAAEDRATGMVA